MAGTQNNIIRWLFIGNAIIFGVGNFARQVYAPLLINIQEAFQINYTLAGLLMTAAFMGYALFRFPSGLLSDSVGQIPVILIANIFFAASILLAYLSPNYLLFLLATFVMGCMTGLYITAGYSYGTSLGGEGHIGRSTGLLETFGTMGSIVAPFVVTIFLVWFTWRAVFLLAFLIVVVVLWNFYFLLKRWQNYSLPKGLLTNLPQKIWQKKLLPFIKICKESSCTKNLIIWATFVGGIEGIAMVGFLFFVPTYLVEVKGIAHSLANYLYLTAFAVALITKTYLGNLADKYGNLKLLLICLSMSFISSLAFTLAISFWMLLVFLILMGTFMLALNTMINAYVMQSMPETYRGIGFGLFGTLYTLIYSLGPGLTGLLAERYSLQTAMQLMTIVFLLVIPLVVRRLVKTERHNGARKEFVHDIN